MTLTGWLITAFICLSLLSLFLLAARNDRKRQLDEAYERWQKGER